MEVKKVKENIDDILDSLFSNGKMNFRKAKEDQEKTEKALEQMQDVNANMNASLRKSIEELTKETQLELSAVEKRLQKDGFSKRQNTESVAVASDSLVFTDEIQKAFETAEATVRERVIGQGVFVSTVALAFKRPYVTGAPDGMPRSITVLMGKNGTGKHMALENFTNELQKLGVLKSGSVTYINLENYNTPSSEKVFLQDFYAAVKKETQVIAFENFEQGHRSVLTLVSSLFTSGNMPLQGRYALQKGMLVDIGSALVPGAISEITVAGKYLFLITEKDERKLVDVFGMPFLSACEDICRTADFTPESIGEIAKVKLTGLCEEVKSRYGLTLTYDAYAVETLVAKIVPDEGVESLQAHLSELMKAIGEYKLKNASVGGEGAVIGFEGRLAVELGAQRIETKAGAKTDSKAVEEIKQELHDIVGLSFIKDYILSLEDNFTIQQMRRAKGLRAESPSMHMIFTGNPGTGKTTVARIVSRYLKAIGVLSGGQLIEVTRADLVGQYVGHTAPLTQKAVESALGGVLFIDEAYSLFRGNDDSFGLEAIDTLVKAMEDNRDSMVVILAGYSREMEEFLTANSGLKSRFPNIIEFPDYTAKELVLISKSIVASKGYTMDASCEEPLFVYFDIMQKTGDARTNGNGRMARNKVEEAIIGCSKRNIALPEAQRNLELLLPEDFRL